MSGFVLVASLKNVTGSLERFLGLLRRRAFPVERLSLYHVHENIFEVVVRCGDVNTARERVAAEIDSLFDVLSVSLPELQVCEETREFAVVRICRDLESSPEILSDVLARRSSDSLELFGTPNEIDEALVYLRDQGVIVAVSRSGEMFPPSPHKH